MGPRASARHRCHPAARPWGPGSALALPAARRAAPPAAAQHAPAAGCCPLLAWVECGGTPASPVPAILHKGWPHPRRSQQACHMHTMAGYQQQKGTHSSQGRPRASRRQWRPHPLAPSPHSRRGTTYDSSARAVGLQALQGHTSVVSAQPSALLRHGSATQQQVEIFPTKSPAPSRTCCRSRSRSRGGPAQAPPRAPHRTRRRRPPQPLPPRALQSAQPRGHLWGQQWRGGTFASLLTSCRIS